LTEVICTYYWTNSGCRNNTKTLLTRPTKARPLHVTAVIGIVHYGHWSYDPDESMTSQIQLLCTHTKQLSTGFQRWY